MPSKCIHCIVEELPPEAPNGEHIEFRDASPCARTWICSLVSHLDFGSERTTTFSPRMAPRSSSASFHLHYWFEVSLTVRFVGWMVERWSPTPWPRKLDPTFFAMWSAQANGRFLKKDRRCKKALRANISTWGAFHYLGLAKRKFSRCKDCICPLGHAIILHGCLPWLKTGTSPNGKALRWKPGWSVRARCHAMIYI